MKLGIFTDPHYSSRQITCKKRYNSQSLRKIAEALEAFRSAECDCILCLGDLIDTETEHEREIENLRAVSDLLGRTQIPTFCLMGNHDAFRFTPDEFYGILGENHRPRDLHTDRLTLLFLDACYHRDGTHYGPGRTDWRDVFYPHTDELRQRLDRATGEVFLFLHQNLDPNVNDDHRLANAAEIRAMLEELGRVRTVYQGHYHPGRTTRHNGIDYVTLPALCEGERVLLITEV